MPFLNLQTNQKPSDEALEEFLATATSAAARVLNKPEDLFVSAAHTGLTMRVAGADKPVAVIDLAGLGLTDAYTSELTAGLTALAARHLEISPERIHVRFENFERTMWGCNGKTFG